MTAQEELDLIERHSYAANDGGASLPHLPIENGPSCLLRSQPDEPVFVLCARDPVAAITVRDWADYREHRMLNRATGPAHMSPEWTREDNKIKEARQLADQMDAWKANHARS